jgi:putative dGTPase
MSDARKRSLTSEQWDELRKRRPSHSSTSSAKASSEARAHAQGQTEEVRTPFQKDLDRLLYNYYTRRLARVTQVTTVANRSANETDIAHHIPHNRLTHSLKVGQVARRTAHYLYDGINADRNKRGIEAAGGIDFDVAEFAGRAHDIGHPPFGHAGEEVLNELAKEWQLEDGFEGNAQTFRILTQLTLKGLDSDANTRKGLERDLPRGLDLTYASLASVVKYPRNSEGADKFGYYDVDEPSYEAYVQPLLYLDHLGTLEAQIMDWADDVSYAVHDIEDFAFQGKIPLHTISNGGADEFLAQARTLLNKEKETDRRSDADINSIIKQFTHYLDDIFMFPLGHSEFDYCRMSQFISTVITEASVGTSVTQDGRLKVTPHARGLITILKHLTWYYVIDQPEMYAQQEGDKRILRAVASDLKRLAETAYTSQEDTKRSNILSQPLRESVDNAIEQYCDTTVPSLRIRGEEHLKMLGLARGVIDYVASLTEDDVFNLYRLYGLSAQRN